MLKDELEKAFKEADHKDWTPLGMALFGAKWFGERCAKVTEKYQPCERCDHIPPNIAHEIRTLVKELGGESA